jgi:hypothetical protein
MSVDIVLDRWERYTAAALKNSLEKGRVPGGKLFQPLFSACLVTQRQAA